MVPRVGYIRDSEAMGWDPSMGCLASFNKMAFLCPIASIIKMSVILNQPFCFVYIGVIMHFKWTFCNTMDFDLLILNYIFIFLVMLKQRWHSAVTFNVYCKHSAIFSCYFGYRGTASLLQMTVSKFLHGFVLLIIENIATQSVCVKYSLIETYT
ncbi:hypothetical protein XELAEV_18012386mg [Xenopus laevis]|uniref:Uncharacterized protein n=1 Tax=Xenopus laevis TaxID=8355 RepID=A0A974HY80_XENLA|nr:hypothetical protein XELAEV_18012386mg [Xenopus laevis]